MQEIEAKILEVDRAAVEARLQALGAEFLGEQLLDAHYFTSEEGETLRIRQEGDTAVLCHKGNLRTGATKQAEETEVVVADADKAAMILERLGHPEYLRYRKTRRSWHLKDTEIVLDRYGTPYDQIPEFLEIEGPSEQRVQEVAEQLGFKPQALKPWSGKDVFRHYRVE